MTNYTVRFVEEDTEFVMNGDSDESILDVAEKHGLDLSYQCRMGHCGMCAARADGDVSQEDALMLTEEEREEGYILTCVATPCSDLEVFSNDMP